MSFQRGALPQGPEPQRGGRDEGHGDQLPADFEINARVRQILARRWVKRDHLEIGTTDGVVVLRGRVEREPAGATEGDEYNARTRFLWRLRSELRAIPGVVEVVMETDDTERTGTP